MTEPPAGALAVPATPRRAVASARAVIYLGGVVSLAATAGIAAIDPRVQVSAFFALVSLAACGYVVALTAIGRRPPCSPRALTICLLFALVARVPLLLAPPLLSNDVYRYIWDGRVQRLGHNPYVSAPGDPVLERLHTPLTRKTEHPALPTIYPPAAELLFRGIAGVQESVFAFKLAQLACDALIMIILVAWLPHIGHSPWWALVYAWHPLVALEGAGTGHLDLTGVLLLVLAAFALTRGRTTMASVCLALSVAVKFLPVVVAPLFWRRVRLRDAAVGAAALLALYGWFAWGTGRPETGSLAVYAEKWRFNGPLFAGAAMAAGQTVALALPIVAGVAVSGVLAVKASVTRPATWAWPIAATLCLMPAVYPWYLLWVTPFLVGAASIPLLVWSLTVLLTYIVWQYELTGVGWVLPPWVAAVEYGAVIAAALATVVLWKKVEGRRVEKASGLPVMARHHSATSRKSDS